MIAQIISNYLVKKVPGHSEDERLASEKILVTAISESDQFLAPLMKSLEMEGSTRVKAHCDAHTPSPHCPAYSEYPSSSSPRIPSNNSDCYCGSQLSGEAQSIVAGSEPKFNFHVVDAFHGSQSYYPHIWETKCQGSQCNIDITTVYYF